MLSTAEALIKRVKRLQNGDVSRAMQRMGINYTLNYGVSLPQLRQLANEQGLNNELATVLLELDIREAKILASMLFNAGEISNDILLQISLSVDNLELVEQYSQNCFAPKSELLSLILELDKGNSWQQLLALYSVGWHIKKSKIHDEQALEWGVNKISALISSDDLLNQKALSFLMQSLASYNEHFKNKMLKLADDWLKSKNNATQQMAQDFLWLNMV